MFSLEKKNNFSIENNQDFINNESNDWKNKVNVVNDLKWLNFIFLEITLFQLIFFGIFPIFSIILVLLQIFLFYRINKILKIFPTFKTDELDEIAAEANKLLNFVQLTFLLSIIDILLIIFGIVKSIGYNEFTNLYKQKFFYISIFFNLTKIVIIYFIKKKINKINLGTEIIFM